MLKKSDNGHSHVRDFSRRELVTFLQKQLPLPSSCTPLIEFPLDFKSFFSSIQANEVKQKDEFIADPRRLRRWMREMENELDQFPSITDAIKLKEIELLKLQKRISVSKKNCKSEKTS